MNTEIIQVNELTKQYSSKDQAALKGISFNVQEGEIFSLLGPNGAGKTTIISILTGLLQPSSGDAKLCGHSIMTAADKVKQSIGVVPQEIALYPMISVKQNLTFFARIYGLSGKKLAKAVDRAMQQVNLTDRANVIVSHLSGGMQRRLNIAVALLHEPKILFMDEPTVGIDPQNRNYILERIKTLNRQGVTIFYTSHYMEEVEDISHRIAVIDHGDIVAIGSHKQLLDQIQQFHTVSFDIDINYKTELLILEMKNLTEVEKVIKTKNRLQLKTNKPNDILIPILNILNKIGSSFSNLKVESPNLETVFLTLTGHKLRD